MARGSLRFGLSSNDERAALSTLADVAKIVSDVQELRNKKIGYVRQGNRELHDVLQHTYNFNEFIPVNEATKILPQE